MKQPALSHKYLQWPKHWMLTTKQFLSISLSFFNLIPSQSLIIYIQLFWSEDPFFGSPGSDYSWWRGQCRRQYYRASGYWPVSINPSPYNKAAGFPAAFCTCWTMRGRWESVGDKWFLLTRLLGRTLSDDRRWRHAMDYYHSIMNHFQSGISKI